MNFLVMHYDFTSEEHLKTILNCCETEYTNVWNMFKEIIPEKGTDSHSQRVTLVPLTGCWINEPDKYTIMLQFRLAVGLLSSAEAYDPNNDDWWKQLRGLFVTNSDFVKADDKNGLLVHIINILEETDTKKKAAIAMRIALGENNDDEFGYILAFREHWVNKENGKCNRLTFCHHPTLCELAMGNLHYRCIRPSHLRFGRNADNKGEKGPIVPKRSTQKEFIEFRDDLCCMYTQFQAKLCTIQANATRKEK
jgi:hypothetical protein